MKTMFKENVCNGVGRRIALPVCLFVLFACCVSSMAVSQPDNIHVTVVSGVDHAPLTVAVESTLDLESAQSDSRWISAEVGQGGKSVLLDFYTKGFKENPDPATVSIFDGTAITTFTVAVDLVEANITTLKVDPLRSRCYGVQQSSTNQGCIVVFNFSSGRMESCISVGKKPTDMTISSDGSEMLVINSADPGISVIDLEQLFVSNEYELSEFNSSNSLKDSAHIGYGPGNIVYYSDGDYSPGLYAFDRSNGTAVRVNDISDGCGYFALSADLGTLYCWRQYSWTGRSNSRIMSYTVNSDGTLDPLGRTDGSDPNLNNWPVDGPIFLGHDELSIYAKRMRVNASPITEKERIYSDCVYSVSPGSELLGTSSAIIDAKSGVKLIELSGAPVAQDFSSDSTCFIYFDTDEKTIKTIDLTLPEYAGMTGLQNSPSNCGRVLDVSELSWAPVVGADSYQVYLGTQANDVTWADTNAVEYLGSSNASQFTLDDTSFTAGQRYYWRVDAVTQYGVNKGAVRQFEILSVIPRETGVEAIMFEGQKPLKRIVEVSNPGAVNWGATCAEEWVSVSISDDELEITLDPSALGFGEYSTFVQLNGAEVVQTIEIHLTYQAFKVRHIKSDPQSVYSYAVVGDSPYEQIPAYLLKINTLSEEIEDAVEVGLYVMDLAVHSADQRVYVVNWRAGSLLAVSMDSFELVESFGFVPQQSYGSSDDGSVRNVSVGPAGRLFVEDYGGVVDLSLIDTSNGLTLDEIVGAGSGIGEASPDGRFYYHGEGSQISKYEIENDHFKIVKSRESDLSLGYLTKVTSEGSRIFWNGSVWDLDLQHVWEMGEKVYACSADGHYAFSNYNIFDVDNRASLGRIADKSSTMSFNDLSAKLLFAEDSGVSFKQLTPRTSTDPQDGAITNALVGLDWPDIASATEYKIYMGTNASEVVSAVATSPQYLGAVTQSFWTLGDIQSPGTYYWRVDVVTPQGVIMGGVQSYDIASVVPAVTSLEIDSLAGFKYMTASLELTSASGGEWSASTPAAWLTFEQSSGTALSSLGLRFAAMPEAGIYKSEVIITTASCSYSIPITYFVHAVDIQRIKSDSETVFSYAISENKEAREEAWLLELDTLNEEIRRIVQIGVAAEDLAVHKAEGRIYVINKTDALIKAFDIPTFEEVQRYQFDAENGRFKLFNGLVAGRAGRLLISSINLFIMDTESGEMLASRQDIDGEGGCSPDGRFYYYGNGGGAGSRISKYDVANDSYIWTCASNAGSLGYGSFTNVVSADGSRIFWKGCVFDQDLKVVRQLGEMVHSCSESGRLAATDEYVVDVATKAVVGAFGGVTHASAFNNVTASLVYESSGAVAYMPVPQVERNFTPADSDVVQNVDRLEWAEVLAGATYHLYLGRSREAVSIAQNEDAEHLGSTLELFMELDTPLDDGEYFWRMDFETDQGLVRGDVLSFTKTTIVPSVGHLAVSTVSGHVGMLGEIQLNGVGAESLSAEVDVPWVTVELTGNEFSTRELLINVDTLGQTCGVYRVEVELVSQGTPLYSIPVDIRIDPLNLKHIETRAGSPFFYAISEADDPLSQTLLLEINTLDERIARVLEIDSPASDIAVHEADGRVYIAHGLIHQLVAVDLGSFEITQTYDYDNFGGGTDVVANGVSRIAALGEGRLIIEGDWIVYGVHLIDTVSGELVDSMISNGDGYGTSSSSDLFYYIGSGKSVTKYDMSEDRFAALSTIVLPNYMYGSDSVVVANDDTRVFWTGSALSADPLAEEWYMQNAVFSCSGDGSLAFGKRNIFDMNTRQLIGFMPVETEVSAYNDLSSKLCCQVDDGLFFRCFEDVVFLPGHESFVTSPAALEWTAVQSAKEYHVYLGQNESAVESAEANSDLRIGTPVDALLNLNESLNEGTYYWRVDAVTPYGIISSDVYSFTVAAIMTSVPRIDTVTVEGHVGYRCEVQLNAAVEGKAWTASCDAAWVSLGRDSGTAPDNLEIIFDASQLSSGTHSAVVKLMPQGGQTINFPVTLWVVAQNISMLKTDHGSALAFAVNLSPKDTDPSFLLKINTLTQEVVAAVPLDQNISDYSISQRDGKIYASDHASQDITVIDLDSFEHVATVTFNPTFGNYSDIFRIVAVGEERLVIESANGYTRLINAATGEQLAGVSNYKGVGAGNSDGTCFYRGQYSSGGASIYKFDISNDQFIEEARERPNSADYGNPLVCLSVDAETIFWGNAQFDADLNVIWDMKDTVYACSADGNYAFSKKYIYDVREQRVLMDMPQEAVDIVFNSVSDTLICADNGQITYHAMSFMEQVKPLEGSVIISPKVFEWDEVSSANEYLLYIGTNKVETATAGPGSPLLVGRNVTNSFSLDDVLGSGTHYWRVDAVTPHGVVMGDVHRFTVAPMAINEMTFDIETVAGNHVCERELQLSSAPGSNPSWQVSSDASWLTVSESTGSGSVRLSVIADASVPVGSYKGQLSVIVNSGEPIVIPVNFSVDVMNITHLRSDPVSPIAYAISADLQNGGSAYLLEINTISETVERVLPVGRSVKDIAVHKIDGRAYLNDGYAKLLYAVDLEELSIVRTYDYDAILSFYSVDRIVPGASGRLILMGSYQNSLLNTEDATILATSGASYGGGQTTADGQLFYYSDSKGMRKYDLTDDTFRLVGSAAVQQSYSSTSFQISGDGQRLFWRGTVVDADLEMEWRTEQIVYACSFDGRTAFSDKLIYDVYEGLSTSTMPVETKISCFNYSSGKLLVAKGPELAFYSFGTDDGCEPPDGDMLFSAEKLARKGAIGDLRYEWYLSSSKDDVESGIKSSVSFLGTSVNAGWNLVDMLDNGKYFWRVDVVTDYGVLKGDVKSFTVSPVQVDVPRLDIATVQGHSNYRREIEFFTADDSVHMWAASADVPWLSFESNAGLTSGKLVVSVDASSLAIGAHVADITIRTDLGASFVIPVNLSVAELVVTKLESDQSSEFSYALSSVEGSACPAYLLEINSLTKQITRVVEVGESATDLAIHHSDHRIYVTNWALNRILAVDVDSFEVVRIYKNGFQGSGLDNDAFSIEAGAERRLIVASGHSGADFRIFDTLTEEFYDKVETSLGGLSSSADGFSFYYGAKSILHRFDVVNDFFISRGTASKPDTSYAGTVDLVLSDNDARVFWNKGVFDADLTLLWTVDEPIYACSGDGRYAFGANTIFDTQTRQIVGSMPVATSISTYNIMSDTLIVPGNGGFSFYPIPEPTVTPETPVLRTLDSSEESIQVGWQRYDDSIAFSLQLREVGSETWLGRENNIASGTVEISYRAVTAGRSYEFRIKAHSSNETSSWSNILTVSAGQQLCMPLLSLGNVAPNSITLQWTDAGPEVQYLVDRLSMSGTGNWQLIATNFADVLHFSDDDLPPSTQYAYRVRAVDDAGMTVASEVLFAGTLMPPPPAVPDSLRAEVFSTSEIGLFWDDVSQADGYRLERSFSGHADWELVAENPSNILHHLDYRLEENREYQYRLSAFNENGSSAFSDIITAIPSGTAVVPSGIVDQIDVEGNALVEERAESAYLCVATFSDGTRRDVTPWVVWGAETDYTSFREPGLLVAEDVTDDFPVSVTAAYEGCSASLSITVENVDSSEVPMLVAPRNRDRMDLATSEISWTEFSGATWYRLIVMPYNSGGQVEVDEWIKLDTSYTLDASMAHGEYICWVIAWGPGGVGLSSWSSPVRFVVGIPGVPRPIVPLNIAMQPCSELEFKWTKAPANADDNRNTWYHLWINNIQSGRVNSEEQGGWFVEEGIIDNDEEFTALVDFENSLLPGHYKWWVQAVDAVGSGSWSSTVGFTVATQIGPGSTVPGESPIITDDQPLFSWHEISGATHYELIVVFNQNDPKLGGYIRRVTDIGSMTYDSGQLDAGSYTWWVRPVKSSQNSTEGWGVSCSFEIKALR